MALVGMLALKKALMIPSRVLVSSRALPPARAAASTADDRRDFSS
jgi:hypothetical protein